MLAYTEYFSITLIVLAIVPFVYETIRQNIKSIFYGARFDSIENYRELNVSLFNRYTDGYS